MPRWAGDRGRAGPHPLLPVLPAAADGVFLPVDGRAVPVLRGGLQAVVSFTGHALVAAALAPQAFAALGLVAAGEPVFAAVSPGNARSPRAFRALGFVPIGGEVLVRQAGQPRRPDSST